MAQNLNVSGLATEVLHPTAKSNQENWGALYTALKNGTVDLPNDAKLRQQLLTLTIHTTQSGWRVEDVPSIHNDRAVAVAGVVGMLQTGQYIKLPDKQPTQKSKWTLGEAGEGEYKVELPKYMQPTDGDRVSWAKKY